MSPMDSEPTPPPSSSAAEDDAVMEEEEESVEERPSTPLSGPSRSHSLAPPASPSPPPIGSPSRPLPQHSITRPAPGTPNFYVQQQQQWATISTPHQSPHTLTHPNIAPAPTALTGSNNLLSKKRSLRPSGPMVDFTSRLSFTYFSKPVPSPKTLNNHPYLGLNSGPDFDIEMKEEERKRKRRKLEKGGNDRFGLDWCTGRYWYSIDDTFNYVRFCEDWGPLNIGHFYRFSLKLHELTEAKQLQGKKIVLYSSADPEKKANAALLLALFSMVVLHLPPYSPLHALSSLQLLPFRDAGYSIANYPLYHSDVIFGLNRALCVPSTVTDRSVTYVEDEAPGVEPVEKVVNVGPPKGGLGGPLLDLATFNVEEYERYETVEEGDWNWLVKQTWYKDVGDESRPGSPSSPSSVVDGGRPRLEKRYAGFIAFASPKEDDITSLGSPRSTSSDSCYHYYENAPNTSRARRAAGKRLNKAFWNVLNCFENNGVKLVIRLNRVQYPKEWFTELGIEHREMYFHDGTNPTLEMCREFIDICDAVIREGGVVAVHCQAGLGRTGTLIGAYMIWKWGFTASEAIGYMRLMRPGSCVGPQQHFLYDNQHTWIQWAAIDAVKATMASNPSPSSGLPPPLSALVERPVTPPSEADIAIAAAASASTSAAAGAVPRTPSNDRSPQRQQVIPGQPRKTPGTTKGKHHTVVPPDEDGKSETKRSPGTQQNGSGGLGMAMEEDEEGLEEEELDRMQLVPDDDAARGVEPAAAPLPIATPTRSQLPSRKEIVVNRMTTTTTTTTTNMHARRPTHKASKSAPVASISSAATSAAPSNANANPVRNAGGRPGSQQQQHHQAATRSTRIPRPKSSRPLSALAENGGGVGAVGVPRSRGVKNFGGLADGHHGKGNKGKNSGDEGAAVPVGGGSRYNLRTSAGRGR